MSAMLRRNISSVLLAQIVVLLASVVKSLLVPKILGVEDYGYWQVYVLYSGFVGVFALGYSDGVYLRYGGKDYPNLPFERLRTSSRVYFCVLAIIGVGVCAASVAFEDGLRSVALFFVGADIAFVCFSGYLLYVLQITNRFKEYGLLVVSDKVLMAIIVLTMAACGIVDPAWYMFWDFATKVFACGLIVWCCREVVFGRSVGIREGVGFYVDLCRTGVSLLLANFAGMFVVSAGRIVVELFGDIASYANYSLGVTITNLVLSLVNAVGLAIYPSLKRSPQGSFPLFFRRIDNSAGVVSALVLVCYVPANLFVVALFPQYAGLLEYLPLLFVAVAAEVRMQLLCNTFFKAAGYTKHLLVVNLAGLAAVMLVAPILYMATGNVRVVALTTAVAMTVRALASYSILSTKLEIVAGGRVIAEAAFVVAFIIAAMIPGWMGLVAAFCVSVVGLALKMLVARRGKVCS